jgi:4-hydroxy-tetrahydrodipicolinate synthase
MITQNFHVAVPTVFYDDEEINILGTINHIKSLYNKGVKSVLVCGTTGEQHSLKTDEKIALIKAINNNPIVKNIEIIFGVASVRQKDAEKLAKVIEATNISGIMLGYPPYILPSQQEAIKYTESIIKRVSKPIILYNNPGRTGFNLSVESIINLSKYNNIIGVKDPGNENEVAILKNEIKKNFYYYAGGEINLESKLMSGYNRLSSIAGNIYPKDVNDWFESILGKNNEIDSKSLNIKQIKELYNGNVILNIKKQISLGVTRKPLGN